MLPSLATEENHAFSGNLARVAAGAALPVRHCFCLQGKPETGLLRHSSRSE